MEALTLDQIAHSVPGAAVPAVGAADGIGHWAAAILPIRQFAAGRIIRALRMPVGAQDHCPISPLCWDLLYQGEGACGSEAAGIKQVTEGTTGAAVHPVLAARSLGYGAASPGAIKHNAARGEVGAFKSAIRALDSSQGVVV